MQSLSDVLPRQQPPLSTPISNFHETLAITAATHNFMDEDSVQYLIDLVHDFVPIVIVVNGNKTVPHG